MKITEDQQMKIISPFDNPFGSLKGEEDDFKLSEIKEWQPLKLGLVFKRNGQYVSGFLEPKKEDDAGIGILLRNYKREIEEKLRGNTWSQILGYDFKFHYAGRLN